MSREIKFRAWDKQNKNMEEVDLLGSNVLHIKNSEWENIEDFEVMQFTGLEDKNGAEIYEGDIIQELKVNWEVVFYKGAWRLGRNVKGDIQYKSLDRYAYRCEIIGDIYRNKELLEEK